MRQDFKYSYTQYLFTIVFNYSSLKNQQTSHDHKEITSVNNLHVHHVSTVCKCLENRKHTFFTIFIPSPSPLPNKMERLEGNASIEGKHQKDRKITVSIVLAHSKCSINI